MKHSARIFNCVRCHRQAIICSCCDRGNIYCGSDCSQAARRESLQSSGKRYQNTRRGKLNHAKRQKLYRERKRKMVTHQGSNETTTDDLIQSEIFEANEHVSLTSDNEIHCHFCGCKCDSLLRIAFLTSSRSSIPGVWPLGP